MKQICLLLFLISFILSGCSTNQPSAMVVATTMPVYDFTVTLCQGTSITVDRLISENVSCLHDYSVSVSQVKKLEAAQLVVCSGAGLEDFLEDLLVDRVIVDASFGIELLCSSHAHDHDTHSHSDEKHGHAQE